MQKVKLAAHRGYSSRCPENTMVAFREAVKYDIDMVENDVHMTKDGEIVLMHDHKVDRTTNGTGLVRELTLEQIRSLDAGSWKGEQFKGEKVPTLREFFDFMKDYPSIEMNIELKDYPEDSGAFAFESCDNVIAMIEEYGMADRIYINSFSGDLLNYVHNRYRGKYRLHGYYPSQILGKRYNKFILERLFCACVFNVTFDENGNGDWSHTSEVAPKERFDEVLDAGIEVWAHYREEIEDHYRKWLDYGVTGITVNDVETAIAILKKLGAR